MAIIRVRGGNSGIAEYLRDGQKQGRAFNRDELDMRVCLEGNLSLTENIINGIPDNGQDRYLHITISFRESEVSVETLEAVTKDYKDLFLSAYKEEEVNFYAEAHLPKIKNITDRNTGEDKERKPHIHIVIPKQNLLTGGALDPVGLYKHHEKFHEAIQEKINSKYNLANPKDFVRTTDDHQAQILSRVKADTFKGFRAEIKKEAFQLIVENDIKSYDEFIKKLEGFYSDVRVRNKGKENEYLAVKPNTDDNYINLKSPLFQKQYIEHRKVERIKPTTKQVDRLLEDWQSRVSKEIKYINKAAKKLQVSYRAASYDEKKEIILNRERGFYENSGRRADRKKSDQKPRNQNRERGNFTSTAFSMSEMRPRELVPNFIGYEYSERERDFNTRQARQSNLLLREVPQTNLADGQQGQSEHDGLRRSTRNTDRLDSVVGNIANRNAERKAISTESEIAEFKNIRLTLNADHLLNRLSNTHGIDLANYEVKQAKDGSARISSGKLNLNVSDFLTKEMNFSWNETKQYLRAAYDEQISNEMSQAKIKVPREVWESFNSEFRPNYFSKIKEVRSELNYNCKRMRYESKQAYFNERKEIFSKKLSYAERKAALSVAVFNKLKNDKEIRHYQYSERKQLSKLEKVDTEFLILNYVNNNEGGNNMAKLSDMIGSVAEKNAFSPFEPEYGVNLKKHMAEIQQNEEFNAKNKKRLELSDLSPSKQQNGDVKYKTSLLGTAFVDKGDKIEFPTLINDKDKIALGLELAAEKYKGKIQLTGLPGFKDKAVEIAAERGLEVEFRPKKYQERFEELKQQFAQERSDKGMAQSSQEAKPAPSTARDKEAQPELVMTAVNARNLPANELTRDDWREVSKTLSQNNISFKELNEAVKANPEKPVGQVIDEIAQKPAEQRAATAQELHVTSVYDQESNRTRLLVNDLPMDMYIQTASEISKTDPEVIKMPLLANDELSQFTPQQIDQGFADGQVSVPAITINENGRSIQNDVRVEFEPIDNDSTSFRVIVNGQPMKEAHKPEMRGEHAFFDQKYSDLDNEEATKLLNKLERNGIPRELFLKSTEEFGMPVAISTAITSANKATYESGGQGIGDPRFIDSSIARQFAFQRDFMEKDLGRSPEQYRDDAKIISHIKSVLEEKGISTTYFSDANQSPTAQVDRDIKRVEIELAKEQMRQDHYVKSGQTETALEHKREVIDYLKDKVNDAREVREKVIASGVTEQTQSATNSSGKEMVIAAAAMPKAFQLSGEGKAYDDAFQPKPYSQAPKAATQEKEKTQQAEPAKPAPKISFDR